MLITVGAMVLLSLVILNVYNGYLVNNGVVMNSKFDILAVSLATSIIEDANGLAFDQKTTGGHTIIYSSELSSCGPGSSEYYNSRTDNNFNDFDDYNGLHIVYNDSTLESAVYDIRCEVGYINDYQPTRFVSNKTWFKRLDVYVSSPSMQDTVKMSTVMSYFYFR